MYTSTEDARSDLFLAGGVYVIGPGAIAILTQILRLDRVPGVPTVLALVLPFVTTALVPLLLMRYRRESFGQYGFGAGLPPNFGVGLLLASPIIVMSVLIALLVGGNPLPGLVGVSQLIVGDVLGLVTRLLQWLGLGFLAVYATVKARDAFRSDVRTVRDETVRLGRILAAVTAVALSIALLFALPGEQLLLESLAVIVLLPPGVAGSVLLMLRSLRGPSATSTATLLTPVVLLALGPFQLAFNLEDIATSVLYSALYAAIGLIIAALQESRRSALAAMGLTLAIALFTLL